MIHCTNTVFRREFRRSKRNTETCKFKEVYEAAELDIHDFFKTAKRFQGNKCQITTLNYDNECSNSPQGI